MCAARVEWKYRSTNARKGGNKEKCIEVRQNINTVLKVLRVKIELLGSSVKTDQMRKSFEQQLTKSHCLSS